jgi:23S rRNA (cytidine2498-2'-O)-methyltransferase
MSNSSPPLLHANHTFIATYDANFSDEALSEIADVAGEIEGRHMLAPGVLLVDSRLSFTEIADRWRTRPPVFMRHICPVQATVSLAGSQTDLDSMERALSDLAALPEGVRFSVQTRILGDVGFKPYDVNTRLSQVLAESSGAIVDVRAPQWVVSVVCAPASEQGGMQAYLGVSGAEDNLSDWAGGMRRFAREKGQVSRSEFKLLEAIEVFQLEFHARGVALDLGAAPGGWTRVLRQRSLYVTAVDPGDLHPSIRADAGVRHLKMSAEEYLEQGPDRYDVIVNDMRMDGRDSARLMVRYVEYLYSDGLAVMTLKLPERRRHQVIDHSLSILGRAYELRGMKQLFHNRSEITLIMAPKQSDSDGQEEPILNTGARGQASR